jgi:hypothetical protein
MVAGVDPPSICGTLKDTLHRVPRLVIEKGPVTHLIHGFDSTRVGEGGSKIGGMTPGCNVALRYRFEFNALLSHRTLDNRIHNKIYGLKNVMIVDSNCNDSSPLKRMDLG